MKDGVGGRARHPKGRALRALRRQPAKGTAAAASVLEPTSTATRFLPQKVGV